MRSSRWLAWGLVVSSCVGASAGCTGDEFQTGSEGPGGGQGGGGGGAAGSAGQPSGAGGAGASGAGAAGAGKGGSSGSSGQGGESGAGAPSGGQAGQGGAGAAGAGPAGAGAGGGGGAGAGAAGAGAAGKAVCGDAVVTAPEACDTNAEPVSCGSVLPGTSNAVMCTPDCQLDTATCVEPCTSPGLLAAAPWPMVSRCASHQGRTPVLGPSTAPTQKWAYPKEASGFKGGPSGVVVGPQDRIFFATPQGDVVSLHANGEERWKKNLTGESFRSVPALGKDGFLYVAGRLGISSFSLDTGSKKDGHLFGTVAPKYLAYQDKPEPTSSPVLDEEGRIYVGSLDGHVYALHSDQAGMMDPLWDFDLGSPITSSPALHDGTLYVGTVAGEIWALDTKAPTSATRLRWKRELDGEEPVGGQLSAALSPTVGADGTVYAIRSGRYGLGPGILHALRPPLLASDKEPVTKWTLSLDGDTSAPLSLLPGGSLVVANQLSSLLYVSPEGAKITSVFAGVYAAQPAAVDASGNVYLATASRDGTGVDKGNLWSYDAAGALRWSVVRPEGEPSAVALDSQGQVLVVNRLGQVSAWK